MNQQAPKPTLRSKLLLPTLLVASLLMFGVLLWQDWGDKPLADLPPFYWVVYALFLCILIAMILVGRTHTRSMRAAIILSAIFVIHGTVFVLLPLIDRWNGTRVMGFALGIWFFTYTGMLLLGLRRATRSSAR
jgi:hypothetical protein